MARCSADHPPSINGLLYIRGRRRNYNHWRQLGNAGWSYDDVLPYFRKAEDQENGADRFHGVGGPLSVTNLKERNPLCEAFIESAVEAGIPRNDDFNGSTQEGVGYYQTTTRNARRCSAAVAYLKPAMKRRTCASSPRLKPSASSSKASAPSASSSNAAARGFSSRRSAK